MDPEWCPWQQEMAKCLSMHRQAREGKNKFETKNIVIKYIIHFLRFFYGWICGKCISIQFCWGDGALDVAVIPMHIAWTQYSHVWFTLPRILTWEHPTYSALVSCLPSPHIRHSVRSCTEVNEDSVVCVSAEIVVDGEKEKEGPVLSASFCHFLLLCP